MGSRGTPVLMSENQGFTTKVAAASHVAWFAPALAILTACGGQQPAFTENRTDKDLSSADAKVGDVPADLGSEGDKEPAAADAGANDGAADVTDTGDAGGGADAGGNTGADGGGSADAGNGSTGGSADGGSADGMASDGGADAGGTTAGGTTAGGTDAGGSTAGGTDAGGVDGGVNLNFVTMNLVQPGAGKVDILWVIDNSASMSEEQAYLGANFNAMINQLVSAGHDFRTAVTTTDICQDTLPPLLADRVCPVQYGGSPATHLRGSFVGDTDHKVLKHSDADLVSRFNTYVNQGVDGSSFEHGLKAAEMAITKSLNGQNEPLVRSDAFLAVIVVSDEEDDGIGLSKVDAYSGYNFFSEGLTTFKFTEDDMITRLRAIKGEGHFSISAITPTRNSSGVLCSAPHSQPLEEGTQYIKAAQKSGGILQSICDTNWNTSLAQIGLDLNAQVTQAVLEFVPDVPTIKVYVNNVQTTQWTYNPGNNAVKFNAGYVPAVGAQIKITYHKIP